jgi:hypothetical protein
VAPRPNGSLELTGGQPAYASHPQPWPPAAQFKRYAAIKVGGDLGARAFAACVQTPHLAAVSNRQGESSVPLNVQVEMRRAEVTV